MRNFKDNIISVIKGKRIKDHENTLFTKFLRKQIHDYKEPQRKGTPKGERIGIFRNKFETILFMLTNIPQKEIASTLDISFGLVRKWNTEIDFRDLVKSLCYQFAEEVVRYVEFEIERAEKVVENQITKRKKIEIPQFSFKRLEDSSVFGVCILEEIKNRIYTIIEGLPTKTKSREIHKAMLLWDMLVTLFFEVDESYNKVKKKLRKSYAEIALIRLRKIHKDYIDEDKRKEADFLISVLEKYLELPI